MRVTTGPSARWWPAQSRKQIHRPLYLIVEHRFQGAKAFRRQDQQSHQKPVNATGAFMLVNSVSSGLAFILVTAITATVHQQPRYATRCCGRTVYRGAGRHRRCRLHAHKQTGSDGFWSE